MLKQNKGFTLIELLVVVVIVGLLATIAIPQFQNAMEKAKEAEARKILGSIYQAQLLYNTENPSKYAKQFSDLMVTAPTAATTAHYFTYAIGSSGTSWTATASRTTAGGRDNVTAANKYTVTINQNGTISRQ
ncbi:MAG: dolichyl-phosphate-mannose--protein mannosyltransferase [Candidatus Omnitrophica bacterium CG11_big_fil_rev_8_21_14_0_20_64_10]|nr:MAG: dolichyl-phosphate-mannose--protein mannosyltransferase [Candidatus Omnitrophica bacterium CG11_big_fil_rev_8_21_14_0_20_64_10]